MLANRLGLIKSVRSHHWIHATGLMCYGFFGQAQEFQARESDLGKWYHDGTWIVLILPDGEIYIRRQNGYFSNLDNELRIFLKIACPKGETVPIFPEGFTVLEESLEAREKNPYDNTSGSPVPNIQPDPEILSLAAYI